MSELVLSSASVLDVEKHDRLFARHLDDSRRGFLQLVRRAPGYIKSLTDQMQPDDLYRAVLPKEVLSKLRKREYKEMLKKHSGRWNGIICKADGRTVIVKQAEWEKVELDRNSLANLNQMALQASIAEVTEQLLIMDRKLDFLLAEQHADRVANVRAGIHLYETGYLYQDSSRRDQQLINALQTLNVGRSSLFGELESMLTRQKRQPEFIDRFWRVLRVDKPEVDFFRRLEADRPKLIESIKYVNLASVYIFRIHALLDEQEAAEHSKRQFVEFCDFILGNVNEGDSPHPYELVERTRGFRQLGQRTQALKDVQSDLVIEAKYEELRDVEV